MGVSKCHTYDITGVSSASPNDCLFSQRMRSITEWEGILHAMTTCLVQLLTLGPLEIIDHLTWAMGRGIQAV
jgi:hypothetical protein